MAVLVAYEESGKVTAALRALGIEAFSNDKTETRGNPDWHIQCDAMEVIFSRRWDAIITHKVCKYMANSGIKWLYNGGRKENGRDEKRWSNMRRDAEEFKYVFCNAPTDIYIAENPRMHPYALEIIGLSSSQHFQPWHHGHKEMKETHLWNRGIRNMPHSNIVGPPPKDKIERRKWAKVHRCPPGPFRERMRSETLDGIALALAAHVAESLRSQ